MTIRATIDRAGRFPVVQTPCPAFKGSSVDLSAPRAGILHTTEGAWNPSMNVFRVHFAPHFIVGLNPQGQAEIAQLVPIGTVGAACRAHNNKAVVEVEMVAFSKETPWLPDDETLEALASLMLVCRDEWGIPLSHPWPDGDYGRAGRNPHRSSGKFGSVAGWFGHGDMPDPDSHWDPGDLRWTDVFARAKALDGEPAPAPTHDIAWAQTVLNAAGATLVVDGTLGPLTRAALSKFQTSHGLLASGVLTPPTIAALAKVQG